MKNIINKIKSKRDEDTKKFDNLLLITFFTGVLLIVSTYAWFFASLNVRVNFLNLIVSDENGLFISLDGVTFSNTVSISEDLLINSLKNTYPNHTNQWASHGMYPVSSNGISNSNDNKYRMFGNSRLDYKLYSNSKRKVLNVVLIDENTPKADNFYIAFDLFLKNVTGSPFDDNLFLNDGTAIYFDNQKYNDSDGTLNSIRFGFLRLGSTSSKSDINTIQNLDCNNECVSTIYEPNSKAHSANSIKKATDYGITLINGIYTPTFALVNEGKYLEIANGHAGTGIPYDNEHFSIQNNITDFSTSLFPIPNGITKVRVYIWLEGQDADSLDTYTKGSKISIAINLIKDNAGYQ